MPKSVKYKKPRLINPVSVTLALMLAFADLLTYKFLPVFLKKQEAYRVLDEHASLFGGSRNRYLAVPEEVDNLERQMRAELQRVGVDDPEFETWIEIDSEHEVRFGVAYIEVIHWPFDIVEPKVENVQIEYQLLLGKRCTMRGVTLRCW